MNPLTLAAIVANLARPPAAPYVAVISQPYTPKPVPQLPLPHTPREAEHVLPYVLFSKRR